MRTLFIATVFLGSALLFLIQPMIAKMILPRFGGSPEVWNACMVFFQAALLAGYAYAHWSVRWLGARRQAFVHVALLALGLASLPIAVARGWVATPGQDPAPVVLALLAASVGLPFFVVSAGAPLLQRWFATTDDAHAHDPYFLYSASNAGSMLALLAYPLIVEPRLRLVDQSRLWSAGYVGLLVAMAVTMGAFAMRGSRAKSADRAVEPEVMGPPIEWTARLRWIALSFVPSSLLLGVTTYLTGNIAPIPMLWVVPLSLYLGTFILAFARKPMIPVQALSRILPLILTPLALVMILESTEPMVVLASMHLIAFVVCALMCHSLLAESRPPAGRLTEFYLWISVGGVLGGIFTALVAPVIFRTLVEYPLALVLACLLRPTRTATKAAWLDYAFPAIVGLAVVAAVLAANALRLDPGPQRTALTMGFPAILCFLAADRSTRFGLGLGALLLASNLLGTSSQGTVEYAARSFFGVHRVLDVDHGAARVLVHGNTVHGRQDLDPRFRRTPLTYYYPTGPIGQVFTSWKAATYKPDIALVGLGVGSLAAYGVVGQRMTYFEIDPVVSRIAHDPRFFTFLADSPATVDVKLGDARLTLAQERPGQYGLIVLDAFSSDSIPVHLITWEAVQMYLTKLAPRGILAFHISNRYLSLGPVLAEIAKSLDLVGLEQTDDATAQEAKIGKTQSHWVLMGRTSEDLRPFLADPRWDRLAPKPGAPLWTDDYSNLLSAFHPGE